MTSAVLRLEARTAALRLSPDAIAVATLALLSCAVCAATWGAWGDVRLDTGYDLVAASRVAHGQLPYVDFTYYYGPLAPLALGAAFWVGGLGGVIAVGLVSSALLVALTYALARVFVDAATAFGAAAIVVGVAASPTNFSFVLPHTSAMTFGVAATMGALLVLARTRHDVRPSRLVAAGALLGLVALTKPEIEVAALAGAAAWAWSRRIARRDLALLAGSAAAVPAVVYGAFLTKVSLHALAFDNLWPRRVLAAGGNRLLRLHAPFTISSFATLGERVVLYAAGAVALVVLARRLATARTSVRLAVVAAIAVAVAVAFVRLETTRYWLEYVYGWIPGGAVLVAGWLFVRRRRSASELATATTLAVLAATTYVAFYFHAPHAQTAVYFAPPAAVFLAAVHARLAGGSRAAAVAGTTWLAFLAAAGIALAVHDARAESAVVSGPGGTLHADPAIAQAYGGAIATVDRLTRPGDYVLFAPQLTSLYTLSDRPDPLPQLSLLPGALPDAAAEDAAIAQLRAKDVRVVVIDRHQFADYGQGAFGVTFDRRLAHWIETNFHQVGVFTAPDRSLVVLRRDKP
jgi:hypothetical protein